jgi:hypothetical protein
LAGAALGTSLLDPARPLQKLPNIRWIKILMDRHSLHDLYGIDLQMAEDPARTL